MATEVVSTIRSSGGDYTSLSAWEAGEQGNLVTADEIHTAECYDDWTSGLSDVLLVSGSTTDATRYMRVTVASGHRHDGTPQTGFFIKAASANNTGLVRSDDGFTRFEWLDVENTNTGANASGIRLSGSTNRAINCIAKTVGTSTGAAIAVFGASSSVVCSLGYGSIFGIYTNVTTSILNCVAAGNGTGINRAAGTNTSKNCVAYNNSTADYAGTFGGSSTTNASEDSTAPGSSPTTGVTSGAFVNSAANDYHLASGSVLIGAGTNLYSDFTTDIDGDAWPSSGAWDIGFDYRVAGGDVTVGLTGSSVTAVMGALGPQNSFSLSGLTGTFSAGTLAPSVSCALGGESATFAAGTVVPSVAIAAIGLQATFSPGTLTPSSSSGDTVALTGEAATFAQTAPSVSVTIALTGIAATMAAGILSASSGTATITVKAGSWLRYKKLQ